MSKPRNPSPAPDARRDLLSLLLQAWWDKRWRIIAVMIGAAVFWIGVLFLIPNKYRAEAKVIILPPRFLPEARTEPLAVATAQELLESAEVTDRVIRRLRDGHALVRGNVAELSEAIISGPNAVLAKLDLSRVRKDETSDTATWLSRLDQDQLRALANLNEDDLADLNVEELGKELHSDTIVEKRSAVEVKLSPLLKLTATAARPQEAQLLANTWAMVFEQMYDQLTTAKTRNQYESVQNQQVEAQRDLANSQAALVKFKATHNLELYQRQIDQYSEDFRDLNRQLLLKRNSQQTLQGSLEELTKVAAALQAGGEWIGSVRPSSSADATSASLESMLQSMGLDTTSTSTVFARLAEQTLRSRHALLEAIREHDEFFEKTPVELLSSERDQLQKNYLDNVGRLRSGTVRAATLSDAIKALDGQLANTSATLNLISSISNDTLALASVTGNSSESVAQLSGVRSTRQDINPAWKSLAEGRAAYFQELETVRGEIARLTDDVPKQEVQYRALQTTITKATLTGELIRVNLDRWKKANQDLFDSYVATANEIFNTARQLALIRAEVQNLEASTSETRGLVEQYQQLFNSASAEQNILESRLKAVQRRAEFLLQKFQDAQTAVNEMVSDVSVAATAVAPTRHYFPRRSIFLPILMLVTAGIYLSWIGWRRISTVRVD